MLRVIRRCFGRSAVIASAGSTRVAVAAVHEQVNERAREEQEPGQCAENVRLVFFPKKEQGNG